jgi:hypothetical protein
MKVHDVLRHGGADTAAAAPTLCNQLAHTLLMTHRRAFCRTMCTHEGHCSHHMAAAAPLLCIIHKAFVGLGLGSQIVMSVAALAFQ